MWALGLVQECGLVSVRVLERESKPRRVWVRGKVLAQIPLYEQEPDPYFGKQWVPDRCSVHFV